MLDQEQLENRLRKAEPAMAAAFALRISLRALPVLGIGLAEQHERGRKFWWDKKQLADYLLRVVRAQQAGTLASIYAADAAHNATAIRAMRSAHRAACDAADISSAAAYGTVLHNVDNGAYRIAEALADATRAATYAARSAAWSAEATVRADSAVIHDAVRAVADAVRAVARAANLDMTFTNVLEKEVEELEKTEGVISYLSLPLWPSGMPDKFRSLWGHLQNGMRGLGAGFEYWIEWYEMRLRGEPIDRDGLGACRT